MDKQTVIAAYRQGLINIRQCAQILGLDTFQMERMLDQFKSQPEMTDQDLPAAILTAGK
ncbi:hypothetical protein M3231_13600 [Neobacillus mesonae]|nr:hypothetical protein [Neobacillus mesonae]